MVLKLSPNLPVAPPMPRGLVQHSSGLLIPRALGLTGPAYTCTTGADQLNTLHTDPVEVPLAQLAKLILNVPTPAGDVPLNYEGRPHLGRIVDSFTNMHKVFLLFGRQTEKSTTLAALPLLLSVFMRITVQYTSGTQTQATEFSTWKLDGFIKASEFLRNWYDVTGAHLTFNRGEKQSYLGSRIKVGSAFADAARIRGVPMDMLEMDELELVAIEVVPVLQHAMHHSPFKYELHAATPLSTDNTASVYWEKYSIQHEWAVPCSCRTITTGVGAQQTTRRHLNILGPKNLTVHGPVCQLCRKRINTLDGEWLRTTDANPPRSWHAFRFPQLAAAYTDYKEIVTSLEQHPVETLQESFALAVTAAQEVFSDNMLEAMCDPRGANSEDTVAKMSGVHQIFGGVDWGAGGAAATILVLAAYVKDVFTFLAGFRFFDGPLAGYGSYDVDKEIELYVPFARILRKIPIVKLGADAGMGHVRNRMLVGLLGPQRFIQIQYANQADQLRLKHDELILNVSRDDMLTNFTTSMQLSPSKWRYPSPQAMKQAHWWQDFKAVRREVDRHGKIRYIHREGETDDFFHACFNCVLASHLVFPRQDLFPAASFQPASAVFKQTG